MIFHCTKFKTTGQDVVMQNSATCHCNKGVARICQGGGGKKYLFQIWEFACALLGGFGGMLPRVNFFKYCVLVYILIRFGV